jgi:hypothetical protein
MLTATVVCCRVRPWPAVKFPPPDTLMSKFRISGIPTLVVLDAEGNHITNDGRKMVLEDPLGQSTGRCTCERRDVGSCALPARDACDGWMHATCAVFPWKAGKGS